MKKILFLLLAVVMLVSCSLAMADTYSEDGSTIYYDTPYIGKTAESDVTLRASAYSRGKIVDTLRKGVKLTITAAKYDKDNVLWYAAETTSRKTGWVQANLVTFESSTNAANSGNYLYASYIGNVKTHVYHLTGCRVLPNPENRVMFNSSLDAIMEGYRPCGICKP